MKRALPRVRLATTNYQKRWNHPRRIGIQYTSLLYPHGGTNTDYRRSIGFRRPFAAEQSGGDSSFLSDPHALLLQRTKHLLDPSNKLDATNHELWVEADQVLKAWLHDDHQKNTASVPALKRIECCLRLLDRLASSLPKDEIFFASLLETRILHQLLNTWKQAVTSTPDGDSSSSISGDDEESLRRLRRQLTPSLLAGKIDKYRYVSLIQPDARSFNMLLSTTHMFPFRDGVAFADAFLQKLVQVSRENDDTPLMDSISVATVMQAWVQNRQPQKADEWLERLQDWRQNHRDTYLGELSPNHIMYTTVLSGWAKVGNAQRAQQILQMQLEDFQHGNFEAQPDTMTFNVVLDALAKSDDRSAPAQAETILKQMREYATTLDWNCSPDDHTWTNVLSCYSRFKPKKAEKILRKLEEEGKPLSLVTYNTMLHGYAQAGQATAAMDLLQKLESSSSSEFQPDVTSYNTVLFAFSKSKTKDSVFQAKRLWSRMHEKGITPTTISYGTMMQCWAKSNETGAADRAEELLREMKRNPNTQPNIVCYNTVLSAWGAQARQSSDTKALERALRLFQELVENKTTKNRENLQPNDATFRSVLHAIVGSSGTNKSDLIDSLGPTMEMFRFRPNKTDEKLLRRFANKRRDRGNASKPPSE